MNDENKSKAAKRWGITCRTVKNWCEIGENADDPPPFFADDPGDLLEWFFTHRGRQVNAKVKKRCEELRREAGLSPLVPVKIDRAPIALIERTLDLLGRGKATARMVEEEENAHAQYIADRDAGKQTDAARRRWKEAAEMSRANQKGEDCVALAFELLKDWLREEWEPKEREKREAISGGKLGAQARAALLDTGTMKEWERVWDRELEAALLKIEH